MCMCWLGHLKPLAIADHVHIGLMEECAHLCHALLNSVQLVVIYQPDIEAIKTGIEHNRTRPMETLMLVHIVCSNDRSSFFVLVA